MHVPEFEELTEVTLVGWSYGGMIITGVAQWVPDRLAQLVYLDANVPAAQPGVSLRHQGPPEHRCSVCPSLLGCCLSATGVGW